MSATYVQRSFRNDQQRAQDRASSSPTNVLPNPYGFVAIEPDRAILEAPLWRDGSSREQRFSGELLLTIEALTPLLVGSQQRRIDDKHSELVPHMLDDGRVLIAGSSLKGMLRAALSSLLQAPMERVTEHHYTYRPNLGFGPKVVLRPAIVEKVEGKGENANVTVRLLPADTAVVFVREDAGNVLEEANCSVGSPITDCKGVCLEKDKDEKNNDTKNKKRGREKNRLITSKDQSKCKALKSFDYILLCYAGGIDSEGYFARAFNGGKVYRYVLVPQDKYAKGEPMLLPEQLLRAYYATQSVLADNKTGHISSGHPLTSGGGKLDTDQAAKAIKSNANLQLNQLVYIENEQGEKEFCPLSMGHHFQYRWAYTSSVRYRNALFGKNHEKYQLRPELALHAKEKAGDHDAPEQLTAARLIFGYAIDGGKEDHAALAKNDFKRMAGRIAFNHAVEVVDGKSDAERFVDKGQPIQLKILGMPRPSAVEFYLKQPNLPRNLATYGDIPSDSGGDLAGRKFYRHQPDAKNRSNAYRAEAKDTNAAERGTVVRYLSQPGSQFRVTLRFESLRLWELGALLVAIEPQILAQLLDLPPHSYGYAHKLGYGKPLGLGSVRLTIDGARWQENDSWQWAEARTTEEPAWQHLRDNALAAFREKLQAAWPEKTTTMAQCWLKPYQWKERGAAAYPTMSDKKGEITIYQYHTNIRKRHAEIRRGKTCDFGEFKITERMEPKR